MKAKGVLKQEDKGKQFLEMDEEGAEPYRKMANEKETFQQFIKQREVPKKPVFLAFALLIVGLILIIIGSVHAIRDW